MEELKELIALLADTPMFVTWVLIGYLVYKLAVIGSIYGLIKLIAMRGFEYMRQRDQAKVDLARAPEMKEIRPMLDGIAMSGAVEDLIDQVKRIRGMADKRKGFDTNKSFVWGTDARWLREAIDNQIVADEAARKAKEK